MHLPVTTLLIWALFDISSIMKLGFVGDTISLIFLIPIIGNIILSYFRLSYSTSLEKTRLFLFAVGFGIMNLIAIGLLVNFLPHSGTTGNLRKIPLLIAINVEMAVLLLIYFRKKLKTVNFFPKVYCYDRSALRYIALFILPATSILGAIILNNGGSNYLALMSSILVIILITNIAFVRSKKDTYIIFSVYMIALSVLLSGWLRSLFPSGVDVNTEYHIFEATKHLASWSPGNFPGNAYNACLSITILPTVLSSFLSINDVFIFKLIYPMLFALTPVAIYCIARSYVSKTTSLFASLFYAVQLAFLSSLSIPARQQIALLFFGLVILAYASAIPMRLKRLLIIVFFFGVLLSHYSTTYLCCLIILLTYISGVIWKSWNIRQHLTLSAAREFKPIITGPIVILFFLAAFAWSAQLTTTSSNATHFILQSISNTGHIFSSDVQSNQDSASSQFNPFHPNPNPQISMNKYTKELLQSSKIASDYRPEATPEYVAPYKIPYRITNVIYSGDSFLQVLVKMLLLVGIIILIWQFLKGINQLDANFVMLCLVGVIILAIVILLPFASIDYDISRAYQQLLIVLAVPAVIGLTWLSEKLRLGTILVLITLLLMFGFNSSIISQLVGGRPIAETYNNYGTQYDINYVNTGEVVAATWFNNRELSAYIVYTDRMALQKLALDTAFPKNLIVKQPVFPPLIRQDSYIYSDASNLNGNGTVSISGGISEYNYPIRSINNFKNKLYSNNSAAIYR